MKFENYFNMSMFVEAFAKDTYNDGTTEGLGGFLYRLTDAYPDLEDNIGIIKKFILDSGCKRIELKDLKLMGAHGAALSTGVVISPGVLHWPKEQALYCIFHEIAHQYQYKKYGAAKIEGLFTSNADEIKAADFLRKTENVADQYAIRKCRELAAKGILNKDKLVKRGNYSHFTTTQFRAYLNQFRKVCQQQNVTDHRHVAELFYNYIVNGMV
jgi:hypothetical protein